MIAFTHREEISRMRLYIEWFILILAVLILIPAGILVVTKDALPGEVLYPYKLQIENAALKIAKDTPYEEILNGIILGRRLEERKALMINSN